MIKKITYEDKIPVKTDETVARKNKVTAEDFNEIKEVVNANAELLETSNTNIQTEQENQNINIESLQKENAEIKEENNRLKEDLNALPVVQGSGEYVTLDTADSRFKDFKVFGKSEKETGDGMPSTETPSEIRNVGDNGNLYDKDNPNVLDTPIDSNGLGGNVKDTYKTVWIPCKPNTTYTVSKKYDATKNRFVLAYTSEEPGYSQQVEGLINNEKTNMLTITTSSTAKYLIAYVWITGGSTTYQEMLDSVKIEKGTQSTANNEYGRGSMEINVCNRNLANKKWAQRFVDIVGNSILAKIVTEDNRNCLCFNAAAGYQNNNAYFFKGIFKEKVSYIIQFYIKPSSTSMNVGVRYKDGTTSYRMDLTAGVWQKIIIKTSKDKLVDKIIPYYQSGQSYIDLDTVQIEEESQTDYESNKQQTIIFPFEQSQRLMEGDYLADDGIHHKRKQIVLDGTEDWSVTGNTFYTDTIKDYNRTSFVPLSNFFRGILNVNLVSNMTGNNTVAFNNITDYDRLYIKSDKFNTIDSFKTWLSSQKVAGTPVTIEYELAEEEIEDYTEEQKEAWKQIKNARSYEGQTNIFSTDEISPNFEVTARRDLNAILNSLQAQILAN